MGCIKTISKDQIHRWIDHLKPECESKALINVILSMEINIIIIIFFGGGGGGDVVTVLMIYLSTNQ